MSTPSLNLLFNITDSQHSGLLQSFNNGFPAAAPLLIRNDIIPVTLRAVQPSAGVSRPWDDVDLSGDSSVILGIGLFDQPPSSGTWTVSDGGTSAPLAHNVSAADLQTALNLLPGIIAAGGVTVQMPDPAVYVVVFTANGAQTAITGNGTNLNPTANVIVSRVIPGTVTTPETQFIELLLSPFALVDSWTPFAPAGSIVTNLQTGTGSLQSIQQIALTPTPYDGTWSITDTTDSMTFPNIPYNATQQQLQAIMGGNYIVTGNTGGPYTITKVAFGAVAPYTVNVSGLFVPVGLTGQLNLSTYAMVQQFLAATTSSIGLTLEIQIQPGDGTSFTPLQLPIQVHKDVINLNNLAPSPYVISLLTESQTISKSSAGTTPLSLSPGVISHDEEIDLLTGAGPYLQQFNLSAANAQPGAELSVQVNWPASANPSYSFYDVATATYLVPTQTLSGTADSAYFIFKFNGTGWKLRAWI